MTAIIVAEGIQKFERSLSHHLCLNLVDTDRLSPISGTPVTPIAAKDSNELLETVGRTYAARPPTLSGSSTMKRLCTFDAVNDPNVVETRVAMKKLRWDPGSLECSDVRDKAAAFAASMPIKLGPDQFDLQTPDAQAFDTRRDSDGSDAENMKIEVDSDDGEVNLAHTGFRTSRDAAPPGVPRVRRRTTKRMQRKRRTGSMHTHSPGSAGI